jgi:CRP-like cAMP-binding protein
MIYRFCITDGEHVSGAYLLRKLQGFGALPVSSRDAVVALGEVRVGTAEPGKDIISEGDDPRDVYLITQGWACRYKILEDGARQVVGLFVPGDLCDLNVYILHKMDHSVGALTQVTYATISPQMVEQLGDAHPRVLRALWWESLVAASIQREWTVNVGQRDAYESLAHLCCEMFLRLRLVGLAKDGVCDFPLTHRDIADALGLTETHVGRVIRKLNDAGAASLRRRVLTVHNLARLQSAAKFNPNYLHQQG